MSTNEAPLALVTGGTRGIGRQLVEQLLADGWRVVATGRSQESCDLASLQLPTARWIACDLASAASRQSFLASVYDLAPQLLVHNAGIQVLRDFATGEADGTATAAAELEVNLLAPIELTEALLPAMPRGSRIVFVTSGLALAPKQSSPVYCASKAGLRSFAKSLRAQLGGIGLHVTEALPPLVDTDMTRGRGRRKISARKTAAAILSGIRRGQDEIDIGATRLLRLVLRLSPRAGEALMIGQ